MAFALPAEPVPLPLDGRFTPEELKRFDGTNNTLPIYLAIKGIVFDVSSKPTMYGPGSGYHLFAGKDASKGLGSSSLKVEDAIADYSSLDDAQLKVLNDWLEFFKKRYQIVGKVVDGHEPQGRL